MGNVIGEPKSNSSVQRELCSHPSLQLSHHSFSCSNTPSETPDFLHRFVGTPSRLGGHIKDYHVVSNYQSVRHSP